MAVVTEMPKMRIRLTGSALRRASVRMRSTRPTAWAVRALLGSTCRLAPAPERAARRNAPPLLGAPSTRWPRQRWLALLRRR